MTDPKMKIGISDRAPDGSIFTKEALKANDGKKIPLTDKPGGEVIGEATLKYDEEHGTMSAELTVTDPKWAELLATSPSPFNVFRQES